MLDFRLALALLGSTLTFALVALPDTARAGACTTIPCRCDDDCGGTVCSADGVCCGPPITGTPCVPDVAGMPGPGTGGVGAAGSPSAGSGGAGTTGAAPADGAAGGSDGGGCTVGARSSSTAPAWLALALALPWARARRQRRTP
jgi:hypothetical protein